MAKNMFYYNVSYLSTSTLNDNITKNVKIQHNPFDLSIDDMAPLQNNLNSKMFLDQKPFEEEKEI